MSYFGTSDFFTEVGQGNVPGHRLEGIQMQGAVTTTSGDIWGGAGDMVFPTTAETWEIVSDNNVDDVVAGIGMRTVTIVSLDALKVRQVQTVTLTGTTAVTLAGTHTRPHLIVGGDSGSTGANVGTITLQVSGGGDVRNVIRPGVGISHDGHFTIPSNETAQFLNLFLLVPKNSDIAGLTQIRDGSNANATWVSSADVFIYQSQVNFEVLAKLPLASESDIRVRAAAGSGTFDCTFIYEMLFIENT
ncbi:MAG: hypothetical protein JKY81_04530 [Colwellia sp.]|nr:hypothetical protein [Colwellia sp.]